jgi:Co/Zn/Cd efflux system component
LYSQTLHNTSFDEETALLPPELLLDSYESSPRIVNVAILINFLANIFLLGAKVIVTLTSSSLSVLASLVDSALDFMSTLIIYTVSRIIQRKDWRSRYQFPVGKQRLEPLGVLVFSVIMIVSFVQVGVEAVQRLLNKDRTALVVLTWQAVVIMMSTGISYISFKFRDWDNGLVVVKFACWFWCRSIKNSGVQALAQDAMNDVVFK